MNDDTEHRWIWIPHWHADGDHPGFQHYKNRDPVWIKNYRSLLSDHKYLELTLGQRGLLHGLWLVTAAGGNGTIPYQGRAITRSLGLDQRVRLESLDPLIDAGFLEIRASEGLAGRYQPASLEKRREEGGPEGSTPSSIVGPRPRASDRAADAAADALAAMNGEGPVDIEAWLEHDREWAIGRIAQGLWTRDRIDTDDTTWQLLEDEAAHWRAEHPPRTELESVPDTDEEPI